MRTRTRPSTRTDRALDTLPVVVGLVMVLSGGTKLLGQDGHVQSFERWGYPQWFRVVTGGVELTGGLGLLAGRRRPTLGRGGGALVAVTMVGALYTHLLRVRDPPSVAARPGVLLASTLLALGRLTGREADGEATASTEARR